MKDGKKKTYKCIKGETKGKGATDNKWGHDKGKTVVEVVCHDYNSPKGYWPDDKLNNPWGKGRVVKITRTGEKYGFKMRSKEKNRKALKEISEYKYW